METTSILKKAWLLVMGLCLMIDLAAQQTYLPATSKSPDAILLYQKAVDAFNDVEFARGIELASQSLNADPDFFMGYFLQTRDFDNEVRDKYLDKMVFHTGKLNKGEQVLKKMAIAIKAAPKTSPTSYWKELVAIYPKNIFAKQMLSYSLATFDNNPAEALTVLDQCLKLTPDLPWVYNAKGYAYLNLKEFDKAKNAFDKYIELAPDKANPYDSKGDYYMAMDNYDSASTHFAKAYRMNNSFTGSLEKAKKAEWMKKSKSIEPVIDQLTTDLMDAFNKHDLKKYHSYFANDGSFGFVWNGDTRATLDEMKKIDYENITNYNDAAIVVKKQLVGVIDETLATSTQKYAFSAAKKEGGKITADGNWSLIWKLDNGQWKIVQAFETNNLTNE